MKLDLDSQLGRLSSLETGDLRNLWSKIFEKPPHPKLRRELLIPILSYRLQEKALGGLRPSTARRLRTIADELASGKKRIHHNHPGPRAGTRMVRQWQGKLYEVVTLDDGFMYDGQKYRSHHRDTLVRAGFLRIQEAQLQEGCMTARIRCAVYTRKSSEEGLDQSFNSLHAQREACEAFIRSQKHEGWTLITTKYDDGGFSGGNMDRPALRVLIADIAEGKVNTVIVYKVDRLTRSLADFAKIIEQFDSKGVSFVSVTQQFNTTTSMGRLTLNVLLSFAQFECEVTGERIRDKIAASKAKGMWMGGTVPLGYDLRDRKLYINRKKADCVREIFQQYLRLRTVPALTSYLRQSGVRTKIRIRRNEKTGGGYYSRGALYQLLRNHLYVGEIEHKGSVYQGQQEAILDRALWAQVQQLLDENRQGARRRPRGSSGSILTGLLFGESGARYIPTSAHKSGRPITITPLRPESRAKRTMDRRSGFPAQPLRQP